MQGPQPDRAFEVFVKRTLSAIQKESWGRSKDSKELRDMCQNVLNLLHDHEQGHLRYDGSLAVAVLEPLYLAASSTNPKILDATLSCLHKLVAHAWLQGESSASGAASDADVVSRVIRTVIRVGETHTGEGMQLAVIRALLTFTTAEHFIAHGDCLLAAVRMVFNLAFGAAEDIIRRTASNALLQMLNTITKRVTAYQLYGSSTATSRRSSLDGSLGGPSTGGLGLAHGHSHSLSAGQLAAALPALSVGADRERHTPPGGRRRLDEQLVTEATLASAAAEWLASATAAPSRTSDAITSSTGGASQTHTPEVLATAAMSVDRLSIAGAAAGGGGDVGDDGAAATGGECRTSQLAILAEQRDLAGLEAALGPSTSLDEGILGAGGNEEEEPVVARVRLEVGATVGASRPEAHRAAGTGTGPTPATTTIATATSASIGGPSYSLRTNSTGLMGLPHAGGYTPPSPPPPLPSEHRTASYSGSGVPVGSGGGVGVVMSSPSKRRADDTTPDDSVGSPHDLTLTSTTMSADGISSSPFQSSGAAGRLQQPSDSSHGALLTPTGTAAAASHSQRSLALPSLWHSPPQAASIHSHHSSRGGAGGAVHGIGAVGGRPLRTTERDVLLVLTAFCRLASREPGVTDLDKYLTAGKLLALELVLKVLQNPIHCWDNVRDEFVRHLHQPLCLVLLRNCSPGEATAFQLATRLLTAVVLHPKLRRGIKAELGAFYQLLLLRPLETEPCGPPDLPPIAAVLPCLASLASEPQLLVDLFVNYDCDLRAPNLYERTVQALSRLSRRMDLDVPLPAAPAGKQAELTRQLASLREAGLRVLLAALHCLDSWAGPLKEGAAGGTRGTGGGGGQGGVSGGEGGNGGLWGGGGGGVAVRGNGVGGLDASEAERFEAAKVTKSALIRGMALFNGGAPVKAMRFLISSGVVEDSPAGAAVFLRGHASDLDPAAMGEYLGHHEDFEVAAMRAYVDQERYGGLTLDAALRSFLLPFRLPGEAQKIDRLMEAFAERYTADNPSLFRIADAAYVLAFAVIMLNTDAHNPLAERRLDRAAFVAMTSLPSEEAAGGSGGGGGAVYQPALPVPELEGIYDRIVAQEIVVRSAPGLGGGGAGGRGRGGAAAPRGPGMKLAAALGLRALVAPFRSGGAADRKQVSNAERQRQQLMELAEAAVVARGGGAGTNPTSSSSVAAAASALSATWHACTHAAHTRPMLTVSGEAMVTALVAALGRAPDAATMEPILAGLLTLAQLAGLMGLEELCEGAVAAVAAAAGVAVPAPYGSAAAGRQLAALRALLAAAAASEAGHLGSAWTILLRTGSELEALVRAVARPVGPGEVGMVFMNPPQGAGGGGGEGGKQAGGGGGGLLGKVFGGLWGGGGPVGGAPGAGAAAATAASNGAGRGGGGRKDGGGGGDAGAQLPPPPVRAVSGAVLVMWAVTDGRKVIEQLYSRSASLDGEAVVVFVRALCAVSREELDAQQPRVYSLQRLVEVAHLNLAGRIRLIWSKLWAVLSAHLVMASCHPQQPIAAQAVDALRGLAARLLEREQQAAQRVGAAGLGLAGAGTGSGSAGAAGGMVPGAVMSTWGSSEGAMRPFVAVLRLSDDAGVRAMALAAVVGAMTAHARGLGSGWRVALEGLRLAADDPAPAVYVQAVGALEVAVGALFRAAVRHSAVGGSVSTSAVTSSSVAAAQGQDCYRETLRAVLTAIRNPHHPEQASHAVKLLGVIGDRLAQRPLPPRASTASTGTGQIAITGLSSAYGNPHQPSLPHPHAAASASSDTAAVSSPPSLRPLMERLAVLPPARLSPADDWALLVEAAADVAATSSAPELASRGLEVALDLMRCHSVRWGRPAWRVLLQHVVAGVAFRPPPVLDLASYPAEAAAAAAAGLPLEAISTSFVARVERLFPLMCAQLAPLAAAADAAAARRAAGHRLRHDSDDGDVDDYEEDDEADEDEREAAAYGGFADGASSLHRDLMTLLTETSLTWFRHPLEPVARAGLTCLGLLLDVTGGVMLALPGGAGGAKGGLPSAGSSASSSISASPSAAAFVCVADKKGAQSQPAQRGWDVLLPRLVTCVRAELSLVIDFTERLRQQQQGQQRPYDHQSPGRHHAAGAGIPSQHMQTTPASAALTTAPTDNSTVMGSSAATGTGSDARRLRCRCRMLLLLQRSLAAYVARRVGALSWDVSRLIVGLLVGLARELMEANLRGEVDKGMEAQVAAAEVAGGFNGGAGGEGVRVLVPGSRTSAWAVTAWGQVEEGGGRKGLHGRGGAASGAQAVGGSRGVAGSRGEEDEEAAWNDDGWSDDWEGSEEEGKHGKVVAGTRGGEQRAEASGGAPEANGTGEVAAGRGVVVSLPAAASQHEPLSSTSATTATTTSTAAGLAPHSSSAPMPPHQAPAPVTPATPDTMQPTYPPLQLTSAPSTHSLRPALTRLETEAADAAISLLLALCNRQPSTAAQPVPTTAPPSPHSPRGSPQGLHTATVAQHQQQQQQQRADEARSELLALCRHILACNIAVQQTAATAAAVEHCSAAAAAAAAAQSVILSLEAPPAGAAAPGDASVAPVDLRHTPPGSSWDWDVRSGVLARVILVLLQLQTQTGTVKLEQQQLRQGGVTDNDAGGGLLMFLPAVAALAASPQLVVRRAVADYLEAACGPLLLVQLRRDRDGAAAENGTGKRQV